jgi:hypothetical protein
METKPNFKFSVLVVKHGSSWCQLLDPHLLPTFSDNITITMATMVPPITMATMVPPITMATMLITQANTGGGKEPSSEIVTGLELHSTEHLY